MSGGIGFLSSGATASGIGALGVFCNNVCIVQPGAGQTAAGSTRVLFQSADGHVCQCAPDGSDVQTLDVRAATFIAGDPTSMYWAAFLADGITGVYDGAQHHWPLSGLLGALHEVAFLKTNYQSGGISAWWQGDLLWELPSAQPQILTFPQFSALDAWRCCWGEGGQLVAYGLPSPAQTEPVFDPAIVEAGGEVWIAYHGGPVVLRKWLDASVGYILAPEGGFYTTARKVDESHIEVAWSRGPGANGDVVTAVVDLTAPMVSLTPTPEPLPPVSIPPFSHPIWIGCYFASGQYGDVDHPGATEILVRATYDQMARPRLVFADLESAKTVPDGQLLGVYMSAVEGGSTDPNIQEAMAYAAARQVPSIIYADLDDFPQWVCDQFLNDASGQPIPNRIPMARGYPLSKSYGEPVKATPDEDVARIRSTVAHLAGIYPRVALAQTYYTQWQNGHGTENYPLSHILAMQDGLAAIARDYRLYASIGFARLRPSGMNDYPELLDAYTRACAAAVAGVPSPILLPIEPPIEPVEPPVVVPPEPPIEPPVVEPPEPEPGPEPPKPIPIPPQPEPEPEEPDMAITVGQKGQFRPYGSKAAWTKGVVVRHVKDEHMHDDKPVVVAVSTDLGVDPNAPTSQICAWLGGGKFEDNRTEAGGAERTIFDGRNLLVGRPDEMADVMEWVNLA